MDILNDKDKYARISSEGYANVSKNFDVRETIALLEKRYRLLFAKDLKTKA